jgi:hypothetical protein
VSTGTGVARPGRGYARPVKALSLPTLRPVRASDAGLPRLEEIIVLAFAASRVTRAISLDEISEPLRARFEDRAESGGAALRWANKLLTCPLCVGWWVSLALSFALPGRYRLVRGAAIAGAQALMALAERLVSEEGRAAIHGADIVEAQASRLAS